MKRSGLIPIIPLVLAAVALSLSASDLSAEIGRDVTKLLAAHHEYRQVTFSVEDEIVTLTGKVFTCSNRNDLAWSVRRIKNVRRVRNEVVLDPPPVADELLRGRMKRALTGAGFTEIRFQAHEGMVILTGTVRNRQHFARVQEVASSVEGVRELINRINVAEE
jgi:osmotically-inducible protein OsmY